MLEKYAQSSSSGRVVRGDRGARRDAGRSALHRLGHALRAHPALLALATLALGCSNGEAQGPPKEPAPPPSSPDSIPIGPLAGKLAGEPFTMLSGRYYVDQRPGFEKVDIKLYASEAETPCGALKTVKPPAVWLRRAGAERLALESSTTDPKTGGKWEVHYQVQKDGHWIGNGEAAALVVINDIGPDLEVEGALSACFRDPSGSCVAGTFSASYCRIPIDSPVRGTDVMERPPERKLQAPKPATTGGETQDAGAPAPGPSAEKPAGAERRSTPEPKP